MTVADYNNPRKYTKFKLADVITPSHGKIVMGDHWWIVTPDDCILLYGNVSWQCNRDSDICTSILRKCYPDCHIEHFSFLYVPQIVPKMDLC